jgi:citrate lyase subunit beta/citryl-CoA lyase
VAPEAKAQARDAISPWLAAQSQRQVQLLVRINDASTPWFEDDLAWLGGVALRGAALPGVMLPKAQDAATVQRVAGVLPAGAVLVPLIETALGVAHAREIAQAPGVQRLAFGTIDYALDLDLPDDERGLLHAASVLAIESRVAGLASPIAGVTAAIDDAAVLLADWAFARATGFGAKMCIHPAQVKTLLAAMRPSAAELDWARRVIEAVAVSPGAARVDGRMVDLPVLRKAQSLLARA